MNATTKVLGGSIVLLCLALLVMWVWGSYIPHEKLTLDETNSMSVCREAVEKKLGIERADLKTLAGVHGLCYAEIAETDLLTDYDIRRSALLNQQKELPVILWMVVAITISGVALAGLQLLGAYRLALLGKAKFGQDSSEFDGSKFVLRSSVTGLFVLLISLSFFYVFVTQVYLIKELPQPPYSSVAADYDLTYGWSPTPETAPVQEPDMTESFTLEPGGAGSPPNQPPAPASHRSAN